MMKKEISITVNQALPTSFKEIKKSGVVDVYPKLNFEKLQRDLHGLTKTEIFFLTMWIPYIPSIKQALVDSVNNRQCSIRLLIFDPTSEAVILQRANSLKIHGFDSESIKSLITQNRKELIAAYLEIDANKRHLFQCRFYNEWVSLSLYGFGDELLVGHYLMNNFATESHFLKVAGKDKGLYKEFRNHFDEIWKRSLAVDAFDLFIHLNDDHLNISQE